MKVEFNRRLVDDWRDLCDLLGLKKPEIARLDPGREGSGIWDWLDLRGKLSKLPGALSKIGRDDLSHFLSPLAESHSRFPESDSKELDSYGVKQVQGQLIGWHSGAGAMLEVVGTEAPYKVNCATPWRTAIRKPLLDTDITKIGIKKIRSQLSKVNQLLNKGIELRSKRDDSEASQIEIRKIHDQTHDEIVDLGTSLFAKIIPPTMQKSLKTAPHMFLDIGIDESLADYPFELIHDSEEYFCLVHSVGRYVVSTEAPDTQSPWMTATDNEPSMLLIAVPDPGDNNTFSRLPKVNDEAEKIIDIVKRSGTKLKVLLGPDATRKNVISEVCNSQYHVIHFCGHARFNSESPKDSELILHKSTLTTSHIKSFVSRAKPMLCFVNACESAHGAGSDYQERFKLYGLGKAFLDTGSYLIGSRSTISDQSASVFASEFYRRFLVHRRSLGAALRRIF